MLNYGRRRHPKHVETLCSYAWKAILTMQYFIESLKVCVELKSNFVIPTTKYSILTTIGVSISIL